jgi:non-haem Fe2+, alpha-ketoglutarate-dependent halogenase
MVDVHAFAANGYLSPLDGLSEGDVAELNRRVAALEVTRPGWLLAKTTKKPHLLLTWLNALVHDARILDPVERILGPNLLCWGASFFAKRANDPGMVTWHQDSTYWGLSKPDIVTAWVAFTPSHRENGCMRLIPGSHTVDQLPHRDTYDPNNLLTRGQEVAVEVDESKAVDVVLAPGQFSLHHVRLVHGSEPNTSDEPRIGFAIRYLPTYVKQVSGNADSATLVRGVDEFGYFEMEPAPAADFHPDAVAFHARVMGANRKILYGKG